MADYVELHCHSAFSLLDGASTPAALVAQAVALGMPALALTDHDALYGAVPFVRAARDAGIQPILGAELTLEDDSHLTLLVASAAGWRNLCLLITQGQAAAPKGKAHVPWPALLRHADGLICLSGCRRGPITSALRRWDRQAAFRIARALRDAFGPERFAIELQHHHHPGDASLVADLVRFAGYLQLPSVVTNNVHYARRSEQRLHDTLVAIRQRQTLDAAEDTLRPNDEYYLKRGAQLLPLFAACPEALTQTLRIAERCGFQLQFGLQDLPAFPTPPGCDTAGYLQQLCRQALPRRYGADATRAIAQLDHELQVIDQAGLANYLLIVWDIVRYARAQGIRCQGRGSAANSLVAYLLGITPIDPLRHNLVFARFLSAERPVLPDIDLDVDALRREEVIQYLYRRYGVDHVALACTFITFQARSALNDVAKALDLLPDLVLQASVGSDDRPSPAVPEQVGQIAGHEWDLPSANTRHPAPILPAEAGATLDLIRDLCQQLHGLPRHLGQHSGGMVVTGPPIATRLPVEPTAMPKRTVVQWDKEALEAAGIVKIDVLGLRMLSAISEALALLEAQAGQAVDLDQLGFEDPAIYAMLAAADTIGVFQVESRAQSSVLPRLQPQCFADIVVAVSLIRPGPVQGQMVHPYLRRRAGVELVTYVHPKLEPILRDTLGVLLFQEQVLLVAQALAGWTAGRGELLRRVLAGSDTGARAALRAAFLTDANAQGVHPGTAELVFGQLEAFGGYSFPRSHAASFATIVYQSAWLKRYAPVAFYTSLLNNQPMGFWAPSVLVGDAKRHGVRFLPVDVQRSGWCCTIEQGNIRVGLQYVRGLGEAGTERLLAARATRPFADLRDLWRRTGLARALVERLILAGACDNLGRSRQALLWELGTLHEREGELELPLPPLDVVLPPLSHWETLAAEAAVLGLNIGEHTLAPLRSWLTHVGVRGSRTLRDIPDGERVEVVGQLVVHQAPPTAKGHHFLTLEDEHGLIDVILRPSIAARYQRQLRTSRLLWVTGMLQREQGVVSLLAWRVEPFRKQLPGNS